MSGIGILNVDLFFVKLMIFIVGFTINLLGLLGNIILYSNYYYYYCKTKKYKFSVIHPVPLHPFISFDQHDT